MPPNSVGNERERVDRRKVLQVLSATGVLGLAGCASQSGTGSGDGTAGSGGGTSSSSETETGDLAYGGTLRVAFGADIKSLNPFVGVNTTDYIARELMYSRLTTLNPSLEVQPDLAKDWEKNSDATEWTFMLRDDVSFTNAGKVTAEDVKASVELMRSDDAASTASSDVKPVESVEVVDESTVTIKLKSVDVEFPKRMNEVGSTWFIIPKEVAENKYDELATKDYGSGPFELGDIQRGNYYDLTARDDHFLVDENGNTLPYVDKVKFRIVTDPLARINNLEGSSLDEVHTVSENTVTRVQNSSSAILYKNQSNLWQGFTLNTTLEANDGSRPFEKLAVRQAMKYALNKEEMVAAIPGGASPGNHSAIGPAFDTYFYEDLDDPFGLTPKLDKARSRLEEAGYGDGIELPPLHYAKGRFSSVESQAQLFQEQMGKVGINFDINLVTNDKWLNEYWNKDGVWYATYWNGRFLPETVPNWMNTAGGTWNESRWENETYTEHIKSAITAESKESKVDHLKQAQQIAHLKGAILFTSFRPAFSAANDYVKEYEMMPSLNSAWEHTVALSSAAPKGPK
jgi:peptide/nickel transport system substrate-binding protein